MYALDFEYDNKYLSDFGFIICNFNSSTGADIADVGSKITFNTVSRNKGKKYSLTSTQYDECIHTTFDICKNPDIHDDLEITSDEYRDIIRWLNRHEFLKFRILDEEKEFESCYYEASFNVSKIKIREVLYGIELEMITNRPYGFGQEQIKIYDFKDISDCYILNDISDEIGYIYPTLTITCYENGSLTIRNEMTDCKTYINNCSVNEIITFHGDIHSITTSDSSHDIYNDFNYDYFKIGNTINDRRNKITVSRPCKIEIKYTPIIKNSPN